MTQTMAQPLSLKDLLIGSKDHIRPLQSVSLPFEQRPGSKPKEPTLYDVDHNGGLVSILSKTISDSGTITYKVRWANGQQTQTRPSRLRNFYSIVEDYEYKQFNKDDSRQNAPVVTRRSLMAGYHSDDASDEDFVDNEDRTSTFARKQPRRKTKENETKYVFGGLDELMADEETKETMDTIETPLPGASAAVPMVIPESSPTPSPYSSPSVFTKPPAQQ